MHTIRSVLKKRFICAVSFLVVGYTQSVHAATAFVGTAPGSASELTSLNDFLNTTFHTVAATLFMLGVVRFAWIAIGPYQSGSFAAKAKAKQDFMNIVWGALLIAASYLILNTINPQIVSFKFGG